MNNRSKQVVLDDIRSYLHTWNIVDDKFAQKIADQIINKYEKEENPKKVISVFLSLPMSGRTNAEIMEDINIMKGKILLNNISGDNEIIFVENFTGHHNVSSNVINEPLIYICDAIKKMSMCNAVVLHHNYYEARGCQIELEIAIKYGIPAYQLMEDGTIEKILGRSE